LTTILLDSFRHPRAIWANGLIETIGPSPPARLRVHRNAPEPAYVERPARSACTRGARGVGDFLVISLDLPIVSCVTVASMLGLGLAIDPERLANVLARVDVSTMAPSPSVTARCIAVNRAAPVLLDAVVRLLRLLDEPEHVPALAPLYEEEILFRLLTGPCASHLVHIARADTPSQSVVKAASWLREHFAEPFRMDDLARRVGMSVSSLHHHFKVVTAMSPLQYQKQLRLNEARRLILVEHVDVAGASYRVG
jgi:AraC-like DNA-binding protein